MPSEPGRLDGARVLVTRPCGQAGALAAAIERVGGEAVRVPAIAIEPAVEPHAARALVAGAAGHDLAVFVSANAVEAAARIAAAAQATVGWPVLVAVGAATRRALEHAGFGPVASPAERFDTEAVLALDLLAAGAVRGRRVIVFKGEGGRALLAEELGRRGAIVTEAPLYRRVLPPASRALLGRALDRGVDLAVATSAEAADNLFALAGTRAGALASLDFVALSDRVASRLRALGVRGRARVAARAGDDAVVEALAAGWRAHAHRDSAGAARAVDDARAR